MKFTILLFVAGFLISVIYASIETLTPFQDVVWNGGDNEIIKWKENNNPPLLKDLKDVTVHLMAGGPDKQVEVGIIAEHVKGTKLSLKLNVPKKLGPSGPFYFIKYTSPSNTSYSDFSGFFTINGTTVVQTQQPDNANNGAINNSTSTTNTNVAKNGAQNGVQSSPTSSLNSPPPIS
ncbi:30301_t:CDS:2, partial [Gigaspora margarita]